MKKVAQHPGMIKVFCNVSRSWWTSVQDNQKTKYYLVMSLNLFGYDKREQSRKFLMLYSIGKLCTKYKNEHNDYENILNKCVLLF